MGKTWDLWIVYDDGMGKVVLTSHPEDEFPFSVIKDRLMYTRLM